MKAAAGGKPALSALTENRKPKSENPIKALSFFAKSFYV